jgi:hypothetical protein
MRTAVLGIAVALATSLPPASVSAAADCNAERGVLEPVVDTMVIDRHATAVLTGLTVSGLAPSCDGERIAVAVAVHAAASSFGADGARITLGPKGAHCGRTEPSRTAVAANGSAGFIACDPTTVPLERIVGFVVSHVDLGQTGDRNDVEPSFERPPSAALPGVRAGGTGDVMNGVRTEVVGNQLATTGAPLLLVALLGLTAVFTGERLRRARAPRWEG